MKKKWYGYVLVIVGLFCAAINAEFLVVKKVSDQNGKETFAPLDFEDKSDNAAAPIITQILLKYEWPMCTASNLTEAEMAELLAPDVPRAEEIFIQKKLDQALKDIGTYYVVFIPTSLYELCCMQRYFGDKKSLYPLGKEKIDIKLDDILKRQYPNDAGKYGKFFKDVAALRKEILGIFVTQNKQIFDITPMKENPFFILNDYIIKNIFTAVDLATSHDVESLVAIIQKKADDIVKGIAPLVNHTFELGQIGLNLEAENQIIPKVVAFEYAARMANKGLLLRGAHFTAIEAANFLPGELPVLGVPFVHAVRKYETINAFLKNTLPYSVSYGTSLFAGAIYDFSACAYGFLSEVQMWRVNKGRATGYALFINKKEYMESQNNNLFFIPPLAPLISLFTSGEYFHARTKVSMLVKTKGLLKIQGLNGDIEDALGFLVITRDPFKHAQLFSDFLAKNGRIIQKGDESTFTQEEKKFVEQVMKNQGQATQFFKEMRTAVPPVRKALKKRAERNEAKRAEEEKRRAQEEAERVEAKKKNMAPFVDAIQRADLPAVKKLIKLPFNPAYEVTTQLGGKEEKVNLWVLASKVRIKKMLDIIERGKEPTAEEIVFLVNMRHILDELLRKNVDADMNVNAEYYQLSRNPLFKDVQKAWLKSAIKEQQEEKKNGAISSGN